MQGKAEWYFGHLWMQEIVQHYFDTVLLKNANIKVVGIDYRNAPDKQFKVLLEECEEDAKVKC